MVFVNGKKIETNILDTKTTILEKIASYFNTLPKYVYYKEILPEKLEENTKLKMVDTVKIIKESTDISFQEFIEKNKEFFSSEDIIIQDDILPLWLAYNENIEELAQYDFTVIDTLKQELTENNYISDESDFDRLWKEREDIRRKFIDSIESEKRKIESQNQLYETLLKTEPNVCTPIKIEEVSIEFKLNIQTNSIYELFNYVVLNENIPFAKCKSYYKILKDFSPIEDWLSTEDENVDGVFLYINQKNSIADIFKNYTVVFIDSNSLASVTINTREGFNTLDKFFENIKRAFPTLKNFEITNIVENKVVGTFYFPQNTIDTYVFSDLVMNDSLFTPFITIDESVKATKKKSDDSVPWLYLHFYQPTTGEITAAVSEKYVDRGKQVMRVEDPELFPHNSTYIKVKVKGKNSVSLLKFQEIFAKLISIYAEQYNDIVEIYRKFIPDFGEKQVMELSTKGKDYQNIAPELFIKNYSRNCGDKRMPKLITAEEAKEIEDEDKVIFFPRDRGIGEPIQSDGKNQHFYVCPNPEYPYPGIQTNKLANSAEFPYVPCCFKIPQNKSGGIFRHYYHGEDLDTKKKKQQDLVITDKILGENKYGTLPPELQKIFLVLDNNENFKYVRIGVQRSPSSFLNSVLLGLHDETDYLNYETSEEKMEFVLKTRKRLAQEAAILAKQNLFDYSEVDIQQILLTDSEYLDPKLFVQLLENFFSCNIYLFNKTQMFLPKFMQGYYKNNFNSTSIIIYEHMGAEADHAKYPQCELIIRWNPSMEDDTQYYFTNEEKESEIFTNLKILFTKINKSFSGSLEIKETEFSLTDKVKIVSQCLDSFGKTQLLIVNYKGENISIKTTPMAPFNLPVVNYVIYNTTEEIAEKIVKLSSGVFYKNLQTDTIVHGEIGNITVTFFIKKVSNNKNSKLDEFNFNKKISTYLIQYLFWIFSNFLLKENAEKITNKLLDNFAKNYFTVIEDYKYSTVDNSFTKKSSLLKKGKLIVTSEEMIKRLMYVLKLNIRRNYDSIINYHKYSSMPNYYQDITDFTSYKDQIILQNRKIVEKWLQRDKNNLKLSKGIVPGDSPYFIKNNLISKKVLLAQNTTSLEKALSICYHWQKNGYNVGKEPDDLPFSDSKYSFTLFSYINENEITQHEIKGEEKIFSPFQIIGYKIDNVAFYTALLQI